MTSLPQRHSYPHALEVRRTGVEITVRQWMTIVRRVNHVLRIMGVERGK